MEISGERIDGLQVCRRAPVVSHLLVADDSLLFFRANGIQAVALDNKINFSYCLIVNGVWR